MTDYGDLMESDCGKACDVRCSTTKRPNLCKRAGGVAATGATACRRGLGATTRPVLATPTSKTPAPAVANALN